MSHMLTCQQTVNDTHGSMSRTHRHHVWAQKGNVARDYLHRMLLLEKAVPNNCETNARKHTHRPHGMDTAIPIVNSLCEAGETPEDLQHEVFHGSFVWFRFLAGCIRIYEWHVVQDPEFDC